MRHRVRSADAGDLTSADVEKRRADHKSCWRCVGIRVAGRLRLARLVSIKRAVGEFVLLVSLHADGDCFYSPGSQ